ncbi:UDP-N-acetylmuramoyl-tripeptide--D-alanyl-D-alanine ligase [Gordonibacter massiliensis (ex Traore et al. 2017)]|uniref:UDP-N-acetylmuramoyl-tripeptide--D-alanyl-D-alanine ligase n=1 Tax=Gordonibacter massiliensis (ex Traore et al. 2017) TaxID=1841863 RepID=A0A842JAN2_9ACTN|nr:UDP-N-acetylmuramoyl-tripeptide--D-alanyl-D-alanine ligase [Gordonibacter massiliensis (ex Traore et al. 2017)]MBC2888787.1 UDP-N-acetylmuramoyl-tripeptide--D-alanyl-D-alanine ligase [Gordonibacter massiliensis (ex Traore et al. 2017)]MBX9035248.1 UDP-N-acetylmuramoyl-tripeptide--D-alanyl-D-alanine ligase [Gordonibacter massiliensis (ex Traore et al. 2017)]
MRLNAKQIAAYTGGSFAVEPLDPRALMCGVTWDSRDVKPGDLYVALPGERVDGHDFVAAALRAGALGALVMQPLAEDVRALARELGAAVIDVPDTAGAVSDLAREWRSHLQGRVIALTGSTGKTTTKNLVRDVLAAAGSVTATAGNQNNELGVPKTLLAAEPECDAVVVEMGMRGPGQIAELCSIVRPDWGLVVNVGESHIELLGSRENIARAKAELLRELPEGSGLAFVNAADDFADFMREDARLDARRVPCVLFDGTEDAAARRVAASAADAVRPAVWAEQVELDEQGRARFVLHACGFDDAAAAAPHVETAPCALNLRGLHNVSNACAAAAVGRASGMSLAAVADALAHAEPEAGRQEVLRARGGFTVVNDAYNANPDSMRASLNTFCALEVPGRRVAVLGDMAELGDFARACHAGIGELAARLPLDRLVCVGELAACIADAAEKAGMDAGRIVRAATISDVLGELDTCIEPGDAVLVKASHCMGLERVVEGLVN